MADSAKGSYEPGMARELLPGTAGVRRVAMRQMGQAGQMGTDVAGVMTGAAHDMTDAMQTAAAQVVDNIDEIQESIVDQTNKLLDRFNGKRAMGKVPLLTKEVLIDAQDAAIVLVFPRDQDSGGMVDGDDEVKDPIESARKIFGRPHNPFSGDSMQAVIAKLGKDPGPIPMYQYQEVIRAEVMHRLRVSGFRATAIESIDRDEVFLKIALDRDGPTIKRMAELQGYRMPLRDDAYSSSAPGSAAPTYNGVPVYPPLINRAGEKVPSYQEYRRDQADKTKPFRAVDEIRILEHFMDQWFHVNEMCQQKVITRVFPATDYEDHTTLHKIWANFCLMFKIPETKKVDRVRDYFGEQIAFFFMWFAYYCRMLAILAITGTCCKMVTWGFDLNMRDKGFFELGYTVVMVAWASCFNQLFRNISARAKQKWGMKDWDSIAIERPEYQANLEGTRTLEMRQWFSFAAIGTYCAGFVGVIAVLTAKIAEAKQSGNMTMLKWAPLMLSLTVKVGSFLWGKVAYFLVGLQNHKTEGRFDNSLTWTLSSVKLFVALYPFIQAAFLETYTGATCEDTFDAALQKVYGGIGWPAGLSNNITTPASEIVSQGLMPDDQQLKFLDGYWYRKNDYYATGKGYCISGCYPVSCEEGGAMNFFRCETNCMSYLEESLTTLFFIHVLSTLTFLMIPIILTKLAVSVEVAKVHGGSWLRIFLGSCVNDDEEEELMKDPYTLIQFQAKCHEQAEYKYASWGGSFVEDFLELAIGFALLTCFSIVRPVISLFAFIAHLVEYRILAYRMTCVTCRPWPRGSEGIGEWQNVFETISYLAVTLNVATAAFKMAPLRRLPFYQQLIAFILMEKGLLLLKQFVDLLIPDEPDDVLFIGDYYANFNATIERVPHKEVAKSEQQDFAGIDVGLVGPGIPTARTDDDSSSSSE